MRTTTELDTEQRTLYGGKGKPAVWTGLVLPRAKDSFGHTFELIDEESQVIKMQVVLGGQAAEDLNYPDEITVYVTPGSTLDQGLSVRPIE